MILARCSLSGADRYRCCLNLRSSSYVCALEKRTRLLRFLVQPGWPAPWDPDSCCPSVSRSCSSSSVSSICSSTGGRTSVEESGPGLLGPCPGAGKLSSETELECRSGSCSGPPRAGSGGARELGDVLSGLTCCCWTPATSQSYNFLRYCSTRRNYFTGSLNKNNKLNPWRYSSEERRPTEVVAARWHYRRTCGYQSVYPSTLISVFLTGFRYFSIK